MSFPEPTGGGAGLIPLDSHQVGKVLEINAVEDLRGIPVVVTTSGERYLCVGKSDDDDWAARGATYFEAELASSGGTIKVTVVEEKNQIGFRPAG
jgi:hypothetical protein